MANYATDPLSVTVISMDGSDQMLGSRDFTTAEDFLACLKDLGIEADPSKIRLEGFNRLCTLKEVPLELLTKWNLLNPLD